MLLQEVEYQYTLNWKVKYLIIIIMKKKKTLV